MANTVFVGLSGGVDSAVSAALLKEQGYTVVGAFIKIWQPEFIECTWAQDRLDAMRVCVTLGIPFREIDLSAEYKKEVVGEMIAAYAAGETPNPDIACNRTIKFGAFAAWARAEGADAVATGHYARIKKGDGKAELLRGIDESKDQSYFLYQLDGRDLMRILFPVGGMKKDHVRAHAKRLALPVAHKADSQGLCFVGDVSMRDFLKRFIPVEPGDVVDETGVLIGSHDGAALYTVGQRHGFTLTVQGPPRYVTKVDTHANRITVSADRSHAGKRDRQLRDVHWIGEAPALPTNVSVQARYRESPVPARMSLEDGHPRITFETPHIASAGQSVVFYDGERCLGGAVIAPDPMKREIAVHSTATSHSKAVHPAVNGDEVAAATNDGV
ncbi:MAG: tRNA 2-thiouridine(34) synthase MnmA, partial [Candidatus Paceibacterota bacterium]